MAETPVVNASPLIHLAHAGLVHLLQVLDSRIIVPERVAAVGSIPGVNHLRVAERRRVTIRPMNKEVPAERAHADPRSTRQVLADSLRLKPGERVSLALRLFASVERDPAAVEEEAFDAMLLRRFEEMRSGAVKGHSARESLAFVRRGMRRKR